MALLTIVDKLHDMYKTSDSVVHALYMTLQMYRSCTVLGRRARMSSRETTRSASYSLDQRVRHGVKSELEQRDECVRSACAP